MGGGIGSILYTERAGLREHFTYNAVGDTVALTRNNGNVKKTDLYEAFGNIVSSTGNSENNRLANTKERSFALNLDNHGMRYYDPEVGRYLTRDPLGYGDGLNVYLYVHNNPINHVDPLGLVEDIDGVRVATINGHTRIMGTGGNLVNRIEAAVAEVVINNGDSASMRKLDMEVRGMNEGQKAVAIHFAAWAVQNPEDANLWSQAMMLSGPALDMGSRGLPPGMMKSGTPRRISSTMRMGTQEALTEKSPEKPQNQINREKGEAWEREIASSRQQTHDDVVRQITIKTNEGETRVRVDVASKERGTGKIVLDEGKASEIAPLTKNQKKGYPELEKAGGVVIGKGKPGFEGGMQIPPTKVNIIRPSKGEGVD